MERGGFVPSEGKGLEKEMKENNITIGWGKGEIFYSVTKIRSEEPWRSPGKKRD